MRVHLEQLQTADKHTQDTRQELMLLRCMHGEALHMQLKTQTNTPTGGSQSSCCNTHIPSVITHAKD